MKATNVSSGRTRGIEHTMPSGLAAKLCTFVGATVISLLFALPLQGQVGTADVLGTVTDPSGAVILNAQVTIRNVDTGEIRNTVTSNTGDYTISALPNGKYTLAVAAKGFTNFDVLDIHLYTDDRARYNITLTPGAVSESVQVSAEATPLLQKDSSSVTSMITESAVQDLPLNGRNFVNLIQLQAGITTNPVSATSGEGTPIDRRAASSITANGQSDLLNNVMVDGFDNNERVNGLIGVRPSVDGIEEIKVDTNSYNAQVGRAAGAAINIVTKAGTNQFHGSAYNYFRNDIFDARDYFATVGQKPEYRMNEFGGSLGGPIQKNKTFFFSDVEDDRIIQGLTSLSTVPTEYEDQHPGDFSDIGGPNLITMGVPLSQIALNYFALNPTPNLPGQTSNYISSPNKSQYNLNLDERIDHSFTPNDLFFARYAYNPVTTNYPGPFPDKNGIRSPASFQMDAAGPSITNTQNLQTTYTHIFNPHLLLSLKAGYARMNTSARPPNYGDDADTKMGVPNGSIPGDPNTNVLTNFAIIGYTSPGEGNSMPVYDTDNTYQYRGTVSFNRGPHSLNIGAALLRRQMSFFQEDFAAGFYIIPPMPPYFNAWVEFLQGQVALLLRGDTLVHPSYRTWEPSFYVQDDWRATSKLALNLGLRYEIFTPITEAHGQYSNFDLSTLSFILGKTDPAVGVETDHSDISPRVGFAYSLSQKMVLRGGFGICFYPAEIGNSLSGGPAASLVVNPNPPYVYEYQATPPTVIDLAAGPPVPTQADVKTFAQNPNVNTVTSKARNLRPSYDEQFNLTLQREIANTTLSVGYVGVLGRQLIRSLNANQPDPSYSATTPSPVYATQLPYINTIRYSYNGNASAYHALQLLAGRSLTHGVTFNANYTWAHGLTDAFMGGINAANGSNPAGLVASDPHYDYGNANVDIRNRVAATVDYKLPFGASLTGMKGTLGKGWNVDGVFYWQSGFPFTVMSGVTGANHLTQINLLGINDDRPNQTCNPNVSKKSLNEWFDITCFTPQPIGTPGNERAGQVYGPHDRRADLSLLKETSLSESLRLQFRAECFNVSNTPNFALPNSAITAYQTVNGASVPVGAPVSTFGTITSSVANEVPRQFQFALKLLF
jgi:hypothetical protein